MENKTYVFMRCPASRDVMPMNNLLVEDLIKIGWVVVEFCAVCHNYHKPELVSEDAVCEDCMSEATEFKEVKK